MSSIGGLSNLNYNSLLISGTSQVRRSDQIFPSNQANAATEAPKSTRLVGHSSTVDEFRKYMEMTPAQKVRYGVLNELGVTEQQLLELPPEQREAMEKKIAEMIAVRTGGGDQNALAVMQGQQAQAAGTDLFKLVEAGARVALPLINVFS